MIRKSIFDTPSTPRLYTFLEWVRDGQLFIPDFQRPFEWEDQRRLDLLDSVSRGLPIGAFMVWRTLTERLQTYARLGPFPLPSPPDDEARSFLIDGHQRLTTLFAALQPATDADLEELQRDSVRWPVYFDLTADDDAPGFVLAPRRRGFEVPATWLPTNVIFDSKALWRRQRKLEASGHERLAERSEELANAFKDYIVPVLPLVTDDIKAVTDSFVRINSGGKPMSEDKILRALVYSDFRIDHHIDQVRASLATLGWGELGEQVFVNALKVRLGLDVYRATPVDIKRGVEARDEGAEGYQHIMNGLGAGLQVAIGWLTSMGIPGPAVLPYQYQLIALCEALLRVTTARRPGLGELLEDPRTKRRVFHWLWATTYSGYFAGMTGNRIRSAIDHLTAVVEGTAEPFPEDLDRSIEPLERFWGSSTRSLALVLMMASTGSDPDFNARVSSRLGHAGTKAVERIFPRVGDTIVGNRVVTIAEQLAELREGLKRDPAAIDPALAARHFIPEDALAALAADPEDPSHFLELRHQHLRETEARFMTAMGLWPAT